MKNFDIELYDFIKSDVNHDSLFESTKKAFGTPLKKVLNENSVQGDVKPAEQTDKPKETKVEKEMAKETNVDKNTQKEDSGKQSKKEEKKETVKEIGEAKEPKDTEEESARKAANKKIEDEKNKKAVGKKSIKKNEGKVPANPAVIDDPEKTVQELKEEVATVAPGNKKVIASGISDESVAKKMASDNKGTAVQDPNTKTWSVEVIQEAKEEKKEETKECKCGKGKTCACKEEKVEEAKKCKKCGSDEVTQNGLCSMCIGIKAKEDKKKKAKKEVKESKDDFTWGFAESVMAALKKQNFTPKIEKLGAFLKTLEPEKLDTIKLAVMDNNAQVFTQLINSIATGAPFEINPTAPINPMPNENEINAANSNSMTKDEMNNSNQNVNNPAMANVAESKKVNETGPVTAEEEMVEEPVEPPVPEDGNKEEIVTSPNEGQEDDTIGEETPETIEVTPELVQELIAMTDLNPETDLAEFEKGLRVEVEHFDSIEENKEILAKIVADHIKEFPGVSYYDALAKMEAELVAPENKEGESEVPEESETPEVENVESDVKPTEAEVTKTEESKK